MIREAFKDLARLRQISAILARHGFGELLSRSRLRERIGLGEAEPPPPEVQRQSTARRFRGLLSELGPTFIKLGQVLSTRPDILPAEVVDELRVLQDSAPPIPIAVVRSQIQRGLGLPVEEAFESIDAEPLASASIAQVHRARTRDGEEVVVKVQRPAIQEGIAADLDLLYYLARALEATVEEVGVYTPSAIVEEFERAIHEELDFENEAANIRAFADKNRDRKGVMVPEVFENLSSRTVLTLSYLQGTKITEVADEARRRELARQVVELSFLQLFEDGLFHGDPHPGNVLVLADGRIALLDFGLVGRLTEAMQQTLIMLTLAIALKQADAVARLLYRIGIPNTRSNLGAFRDDIAAVLARYQGRNLEEIDASSALRDLLDLAVRYHIRVPKEYALLSRAAIATEGILRQLDPRMDIGGTTLPLLKGLLMNRLSAGSLQEGLLKGMLRFQELAQDVPAQLSQLLMDLEGGKFLVNIRSSQLDDLTAALRRLAVVLMAALLGAALVVGAFISLSRQDWSFHGVPVLGVIAIAAGAMLFGAVGSWYFVVVRLKKIRLARWMKR